VQLLAVSWHPDSSSQIKSKNKSEAKMSVVEIIGVRENKLEVNEAALKDVLCSDEIAGLPAAAICVAGARCIA
jgi:hypothetical protein